MFAAERIKKIKEILYDRKKVDVITLSSELLVSEVTVRRDLEKLENEGFLTRSHGGAILNDHLYDVENQLVLPLDVSYADEKNMIGKICSHMINDNDTIFLGPGSTCRFIAKNMANKKNIKVVTSDILIAAEIINSSNASDIKIVLTGGDIDTTNYQLVGRFAENSIRNYYVNLAFVEVDGISFERGYSVESIEKGAIIKEILSASKEVVAICDYSKFNNISFSPLGPLKMFRKVVSNGSAPSEYKKFYFDNDVQFITSFDVYQAL